LKRLEYRGYDSAGLAYDGEAKDGPVVVREVGTVACLEKAVNGELENKPLR
jgi:glucosamine--fructose-6-phosphate aminotransferase (isomerizing)